MQVRERIALGVALVAMTALMVELLLMRVFDVILRTNLSYMILASAMFAFGLAGVYAALRPLRPDAETGPHVARLALAFGVVCGVMLPILNVLPFSYDRIEEQPVAQLFHFGVMYLVVSAPFFLAGLIVIRVFSAYTSQIRSLYCWDLCGAAVGAVLPAPFIPLIGPGGLMFVAAAAGLLAAALFAASVRLRVAALIAALALISTPFVRTNGYYDFREHGNKRGVATARQAGSVELTRWDPIAKIDVISRPRTDKKTGHMRVRYKHVAYDGGSMSSGLYAFDGNYAALRQALEDDMSNVQFHFWNRGVAVSHYLKADTGAEVLIIGSAGGQETKAALSYNPSHVDAVEMVAAVVDLVKHDYAAYIGGIFNDPRVEVRVGEGRTFLRGAQRRYDIIQMFSNHTSSSIAAGTGAMSTTYLQTAEAYIEYFERLQDDGVLHVNHRIYPKMITTAALAWKRMGRSDFRRHVVVYERAGLDKVPALLIKMSPWTNAEIDRLNAFMLRPGVAWDTWRLVENPLDPDNSFLSGDFYSGDFPPALAAAMDFRILPATDDRPYFDFLRRRIAPLKPAPERFLNVSTAMTLNAQLKRGMFPADVIHFFVTGAGALFFTVLCVFIPLLFSETGRTHWPGKWASLVYFACLGAGFIMIEFTCIQVFMKLVGFPLYTYSTVIFTLLLAAGLGSLSAKRLHIDPVNRWWTPFGGLLVCGGLLWVVHPYLFDVCLAAPMTSRIVAAAGMLFPMSFFMGMPLPLGILAVERQPRGAVAWAWGMNGLFTVIGGLAAAVLSIFFGFKFTLTLAFALYVLAGLAFVRLRQVAL